MELQTWTCGLLVLASLCPLTEAVTLYDPQLCYILDGFLGLYGLIITGMFIHEKFFKIKVKEEEGVYSSLRGQEAGGYDEIGRRDPERGGARGDRSKLRDVLGKWLSPEMVFEAVTLYDPQLCYILDGFLGLYGLIITGMFIHEKFFKIKVKEEEGVYSSLRGQEAGGYDEIGRRDPERGGARSRGPVTGGDDTYTPLNRVVDGTYKALPVKRDRQRKTEQVYQGLSTAHKDTYDKLQMQPLPR